MPNLTHPPSSPGSISRPSGVRQLKQLINAIENQSSDPQFILDDAVDAIMPELDAIQKSIMGLGETYDNGLDEYKDNDFNKNIDIFDDGSLDNSVKEVDSIDDEDDDEEFDAGDGDENNITRDYDKLNATDNEKVSYVEPNDDVSSAFSQNSYPDYSRDTDNLHAEALHNIDSADSVRTAQSHPLEVAAINLLFRKARDRIDTWRISADKEYELKKLRPCWLMCGHEDSIEEMPFHLRFDCPFRLIECIQCRNPIRFCETKEHLTTKCIMRTVGCPWAWKGCKQMLYFKDVDKHMKIMCKCRQVLCRNNCGKYIPYFKNIKIRQLNKKFDLK
jgi:hypothetical protein